MQLSDAISARRTIKRFINTPVSREDIEALLSAGSLAPNHRLTQPWRFYVLGPDARYAYGLALGNRKAKKIEDPAAAQTMRENVANEHRALPAMLAIAMIVNENEEIREEDYAAAMMGVQNICLTAVERGLGTALKSGAILGDAAARAAVTVADNERIIVVMNVGAPAEVAPPKARELAAAYTKWVP
ncbi:MAG: nitroreductase family protein [Gemmatimonas sp.]